MKILKADLYKRIFPFYQVETSLSPAGSSPPCPGLLDCLEEGQVLSGRGEEARFCKKRENCLSGKFLAGGDIACLSLYSDHIPKEVRL